MKFVRMIHQGQTINTRGGPTLIHGNGAPSIQALIANLVAVRYSYPKFGC